MTFSFRAVFGTFVVAASLLLLAGAVPVHAQLGDVLKGGLTNAAPEPLRTTQTDLPTIIGNVISALIQLVGAVLFVYLLYGGFQYMTAGGDSAKVQKAVQVIRNAVIGMVIIALAYAIATFVIGSISNVTSQGPVK